MCNKYCAVLLVSLFILSACNFFVDEEIRKIGSSGKFSDCADLDTSEDKNRIDRCYSYVGKKQNDPAACAAASGSFRDDCYGNVAVDLGNEQLCKEISAKGTQKSCFTSIAVDKKNPELCANLQSEYSDDCYREYSVKTGDVSTCERITRADTSDMCYMHFAVEEKNSDRCFSLNSDRNKDDCYYKVALAGANANICYSIMAEAKKEQCLSQISVQEGCKYDSDCDDICEGHVRWKQGCDPNSGICSKTFDYDCNDEVEVFNGVKYPKTCAEGSCVRNQVEIDAVQAELEAMKKEVSDNFKQLTNYRLEVTQLKLEANHKCLDGLSDVTNKFIIENAVKLGSIAGSGVSFIKSGSSIASTSTQIKHVGGKFTTVTKPSYDFTTKFTSDAAGYFGDWTDKLIDTMTKLNKDAAKPPIEDYIAFWCDYNKYLGEVLEATEEQMEQQIALQQAIQKEIDSLP